MIVLIIYLFGVNLLHYISIIINYKEDGKKMNYEFQQKRNKPKSMDLIEFPQANATDHPSRPSNDDGRENRRNNPIDFGLTEEVNRQAQFLSRHVHRNSNRPLYSARFRERR